MMDCIEDTASTADGGKPWNDGFGDIRLQTYSQASQLPQTSADAPSLFCTDQPPMNQQRPVPPDDRPRTIPVDTPEPSAATLLVTDQSLRLLLTPGLTAQQRQRCLDEMQHVLQEEHDRNGPNTLLWLDARLRNYMASHPENPLDLATVFRYRPPGDSFEYIRFNLTPLPLRPAWNPVIGTFNIRLQPRPRR